MKPANASAMRSTSDQVSVHRHIRSPDELTLSLRPSQFRMSCSPIASTCDSHVKQRCRAVPTASSLPVAVPHAVAATASVKFGWEHSCQGDFVKLNGKGMSERELQGVSFYMQLLARWCGSYRVGATTGGLLFAVDAQGDPIFIPFHDVRELVMSR